MCVSTHLHKFHVVRIIDKLPEYAPLTIEVAGAPKDLCVAANPSTNGYMLVTSRSSELTTSNNGSSSHMKVTYYVCENSSVSDL